MTKVMVTLIVSCLMICWMGIANAHKCGPNQEWVMSYGGFRPTCAMPQIPPGWLDGYLPHMACLCKKGFVYISDKNKFCIPLVACGLYPPIYPPLAAKPIV